MGGQLNCFLKDSTCVIFQNAIKKKKENLGTIAYACNHSPGKAETSVSPSPLWEDGAVSKQLYHGCGGLRMDNSTMYKHSTVALAYNASALKEGMDTGRS